MRADLQQRCRSALTTLLQLREGGALDDNSYHQGLVCVAYEYAEVDEMETALGLLLKVPLDYYENHQAVQISGNPDYAAVCEALAKKILMSGLLDNHPIVGAARA